MSARAQAPWVHDVLRFWFEELEPAAWFKKSDATDDLIRDRFAAVHRTVSETPIEQLATDQQTAMAAILVLDQFPRNMFRDTPAAFASDAKALELARLVVDRGLDRELEKDWRVFLYLPFEHSESLADQDTCVALMALLDDAEYDRYAAAHRDVIREFGRFPHRNRILGRQSTAAEEAFLAKPGSGF